MPRSKPYKPVKLQEDSALKKKSKEIKRVSKQTWHDLKTNFTWRKGLVILGLTMAVAGLLVLIATGAGAAIAGGMLAGYGIGLGFLLVGATLAGVSHFWPKILAASGYSTLSVKGSLETSSATSTYANADGLDPVAAQQQGARTTDTIRRQKAAAAPGVEVVTNAGASDDPDDVYLAPSFGHDGAGEESVV